MEERKATTKKGEIPVLLIANLPNTGDNPNNMAEASPNNIPLVWAFDFMVTSAMPLFHL